MNYFTNIFNKMINQATSSKAKRITNNNEQALECGRLARVKMDEVIQLLKKADAYNNQSASMIKSYKALNDLNRKIFKNVN